jgi:hypothetical protein
MENEIITVEPKDVRLGSISAENPKDVIVRASAIAKDLAEIITSRKLFTIINGRKFTHVEGWSTLGAMLGIVPQEDGVVEKDNGDFEATVSLIRVSDGAIIGRGSSIVGMDEKLWKNRDRYARRSMATTRATGKAFRLGFSWIMTLAGFEPTPAEEMPPQETPPEAENNHTHANGVEIERPLTPTYLRSLLAAKSVKHTGDASPEQVGLMSGMMDMVFAPDKDADKIRRSCLHYLWGVDSSKKLTGPQVKAILDWLKPVKDSGGAYSPDPMACKELRAVWEAEQLAKGQTVLPGIK